MFERHKQSSLNMSRAVFTKLATLLWVLLLLVLVSTPVVAGEVLSAKDAFGLASRQEIILIDIRSEKEWKETGVASIARPISMHGPQFLSKLKKVRKESNGRPIALICATGGRSAWLQKELSLRGINNVIDVSEGMQGSAAGPGWIQAGLPVAPYEEASVSIDSGEHSFWERITGWYKPLWLNDK